MVNPDIVASRLAALRQYLDYLRILRRYPYRKFRADPFIRGNVERYLQLAIECCLDLGNHLISDRGLRKAENYRDVFLILGEAKVLPKPFAKRVAPMGGFRNILVHDYLKVDPRKVYDVLQKQLPDLEKFAKAVARQLR